MRHSFWNVFHGSQAALRFWCLNIEAWGAASTELLQRAALLDPPLHLNVDGTILIAGCGSSAGQRGSTTRNNNGRAASMTWDWVEKNDFIQGKQISRRSFKTKGALRLRVDIQKRELYKGKWICESARGRPTIHCTELRSRWQLRMEVTSIFLPADVLHENAWWRFEFNFMVDGKLKIVSRELNGDLLFFEATWQRAVGQQRDHQPL